MVALFASLALLQTAQPADQTWTKPVLPGVVYRMEVRQDPPLVIHGFRVSKSNSSLWAESHLATGEVYDRTPFRGRATVSQMVQRTGAIGGVNGDFFQWGDHPGGDPLGLMMRNGELLSTPVDRSALVWGADSFGVANLTWEGSVTWPDGTERPITAFNRYAVEEGVTLFTDAAGLAYAREDAVFAVLEVGTERWTASEDRVAKVRSVLVNPENVQVPPGMAVIAGMGDLEPEMMGLKTGDELRIRTNLPPHSFHSAMGGGPTLMVDGEIVVEEGGPRHPRTIVGITENGHVWYVVIDGRQSMSVGATFYESAQILESWGCVTGINLDGGGSSTLNLLGNTLNRPSAGQERTVANGILVYGQRPDAVEGAFEIDVQGDQATLVRDGEAVPHGRVLWSAQGAAWIDQSGVLRKVETGEATVRATFSGMTVERVVQID